MSEVDLASMADSANIHKEEKHLTPIQEVNDCLKACKFGWFNIKLLLVTLVGFVSGVSVSNTTSYLLPSAECDLHMTLLQKGILNAMPYLGMLFSSVLAGFLTDTFGRKIFLLLGFGGMFIFTVIAGTSQTFDVLVSAKFFEGMLFASSFNAAVSLSAEFCHNGIRDRIIILQSSFLALAQVIIAAIAWVVLIQDWKYTFFDGYIVLNTWNFYLLIMSIWSLMSFIMYATLPESPKYLVMQKEYTRAREILINIYKQNTGKPADTYPSNTSRYDHVAFNAEPSTVATTSKGACLANESFFNPNTSISNVGFESKEASMASSIVPVRNIVQMDVGDTVREQSQSTTMDVDLLSNTGKALKYKNIWTNEIKKEIDAASQLNKDTSFSHQIVVGFHNIKPMFKRPLVRHLIVICLINFMTMASYNIIRLWFPQVSTVVEHYQSGDKDLCTMLDSYTEDLKQRRLNTTSETQCVPNKSGAETYINSMIIGSLSIVPILLTGMLVNRIGKKVPIIMGCLIFSGATLGMRWANSKTAIVALFAVSTCVGQTTKSLIQAFVVEYFSTSTRSLALSIMMTLGRIGTLLGNIAFPVLLSISCELPFFLISAVMLCLASVGFFLPAKKEVKIK